MEQAATGGADETASLRNLPAVDEVLRTPAAGALLAQYPRALVVRAARNEIDRRRAGVRAGESAPGGLDFGAPTVARDLEAAVLDLLRPSLRPALNATGVIVHTNLGRTPLAARALERLQQVASGYCTLEYDVDRRDRGSRHDHVADLLLELSGAEASAVVNNNAAAVWLALAALAAGREVVVSRGELVEIGGGFRIPDVMRASGAHLVEVGTTNRTRLADYEAAHRADTALFLRVHRSNFAIVGFTEEPELGALAGAARARGIALMVDAGSGALVDLSAFGLTGDPVIADLVKAGADIVTFSGDKLLGGPQAGIIVGRADLVEKVRAHPLMRAVRPDKLTLAALEATLELYRDGNAVHEVPVLKAVTAPGGALAGRRDRLLGALRGIADLSVEARRSEATVGGGASPLARLPSWAVGLRHARLDAEAVADRLVKGSTPLVGRIEGGSVLLDVRTLSDDQIDTAAGVVHAAFGRTP